MKVRSIFLAGAVACAQTLVVMAEQPVTVVEAGERTRYEANWESLTFTAAQLAPDTLPCQHAWVFKIER